MSLSQLAPAADILAAIGVIFSLIFLAHELRQNRKQSELANWRDLLESLSNYKGLTNDLAFSEFLERAEKDYHALTPAEQRSFGMYLEQGIHIIGNFVKHNDTIPTKLVGMDDAIHSLLRDLLNNDGARAWWTATKPKRRFMPQTYVMVDTVLDQYGTS
jgi:hypothetical protein